MNFSKCTFLILMVCSAFDSISASHKLSLIARAGLIASNAEKSFFDQGVDVTRYQKNGLQISQVALELESDWQVGLSSHLTGFYYPDGNKQLGIAEAYLKYKPLQRSSKKWALRAGLFYPEFSVENTDIAWLSPDTFSFSAINSWYAEELRVAGAELSYSQNGRRVRSKWSWDLRASLFKGNDPLGSLLAWRGFAVHDRQALLNEHINFAPLPDVTSQEFINSPSDVPPFKEIDGLWGGYIGMHLTYLRRAELTYYRYDNLANPDRLTTERYYSWRTKFHNIGLNYQINPKTNLKAQALLGSTFMGMNVVTVEYSSAFLQVNHQLTEKLSATARAEVFDVIDIDTYPVDNNHSNGSSLTMHLKRQLTKDFAIGAELNLVKGTAYNRSSLGFNNNFITRQLQILGEWRL